MLFISVREGVPCTRVVEIVVEILQRGGIAILPTETVYGLVARAQDEKAVRRVYEVKRRGPEPLTVHVASLEQARELVERMPKVAELLAESLWPGPLTMVLKKSNKVPDFVTAGLNKVGIRIPRHTLTLEVIRRVGPTVMPSANVHDNPSPTSAYDAIEDLGHSVDVVVDAGECELGIDSTVVDLSEDVPKLLRPGAVPIETLRELGLRLEIPDSLEKLIRTRRKYLRDVELVVVTGRDLESIGKKIREEANRAVNEGKKVMISTTIELSMILRDILAQDNVTYFCLGSHNNPLSIARLVYKMFRTAMRLRVDVVYVEALPLRGIYVSVMDRIVAASSRIV